MTNVDLLIERGSFPNAWARAVRTVMRDGKQIEFGGKIKGKEQYEKKGAMDIDLNIVLEGNAIKEAINGKLHPQFPTKEKVLAGYLKEWERGYDWRKQGFTYCYENRIENYPDNKYCLDGTENDIIDQWKLAKEDLAQQIETGIQSNRNVIVIGNPSIDRFEIPDSPPCLREIWIRHEGNHKVSVKWFFRSRDLFSAWQTNVIGLLSAVKREVTDPNDCEIIQVIDKNHSLYIYEGDWKVAREVTLLPYNPHGK